MKKNTTCRQSPGRRTVARQGSVTIGMDLGDKTSRYCVLEENGEVQAEGSVATTRKAMAQKFAGLRGRCRIDDRGGDPFSLVEPAVKPSWP